MSFEAPQQRNALQQFIDSLETSGGQSAPVIEELQKSLEDRFDELVEHAKHIHISELNLSGPDVTAVEDALDKDERIRPVLLEKLEGGDPSTLYLLALTKRLEVQRVIKLLKKKKPYDEKEAKELERQGMDVMLDMRTKAQEIEYENAMKEMNDLWTIERNLGASFGVRREAVLEEWQEMARAA